jgi:tyrosyl-tRNA synthetase
MANFIDTLVARGFAPEMTNPALRDLLDKEPITAYIGFDPTAPSLHIGSLKQIMLLAQLQRHGHRPLPLVGGGTGMIGDPSGKTKERQLLSKDDIQFNLNGIRGQLERFLDFSAGQNAAVIVNNADWLCQFTFVDFLRDVGKHFRVGEMLGKESVRVRIQSDEGMSFTEFCYSLLQSYDFLHLYEHYNCVLQMGGSDQWGNITAGIELVRKLRGGTAYGITTPLVVTATGQKFGKTEAGTIWLAADRTSPYEFYQYWFRTDDRDVIPFLKIFTFLPLDEIAELERSLALEPEKRIAQQRLAKEVTELVHGESISTLTASVSGSVFESGGKPLAFEDLKSVMPDISAKVLPKARLESGVALLDLMVEQGAAKSKSEARRLIIQGGVYVNDVRVDSEDRIVSMADVLPDSMIMLRTGKKNYIPIRVV